MKILLIGKTGQVGFELSKKLNSIGEIVEPDRQTLDICNPDNIKTFVEQIKPDLIINAAAYTAVDKAETEPYLAHKINSIAPGILASKAAELDIPLIHFSTDYVFDGSKNSSYLETDIVNPQSVYGKTKHEGEEAVRKWRKHIILRTSWVFGCHGNNFLKTILRFIQEKESLHIVNDQWGSPTSSSMLADVTYKIVEDIFKDENFKKFGTYHITSLGETNWYQFAVYIYKEAAHLGFKAKIKASDIKSIPTSEYHLLAKRPLNSRLGTEKIEKIFMLKLPSWQIEAKRVLRELIK